MSGDGQGGYEVLDGMLVDGDRLGAALAAFRPLVRPEFVRAFVDRDLAALAAGAAFATSNAAAGHLRIHASPNLVVRVRAIPAGDPPATVPIVTLTRHTLVGNAGRSALRLQRWHQPNPLPNDVFDRRKTLTRDSDLMLGPGEAVAFHAARHAFAYAGCEGSGVALTAAGPHVVPLAWHYDAASRQPIRLAPAHKDWLFVQALLRFADGVGDASLGPVLASLHEHPSHFIRWGAAQTAHRIAPEAGRDALRALTSDPHPQLRAAAQFLLAGTASP